MKLFKAISLPEVERILSSGISVAECARRLIVSESVIKAARVRLGEEAARNTPWVIARANAHVTTMNNFPPGDGGNFEVELCVNPYP